MNGLRDEMKTAYVNGNMTYREIAERFGVSRSTVGRYAKADLWRELRRDARLMLPPFATEDRYDMSAEPTPQLQTPNSKLHTERASLNDEVASLALRVAQLGADAAGDDKQFLRYIVSERSGRGETETVERVFAKLDTKAYRELTSAIKDLWAIAQDSGEGERSGVVVKLGDAAELAE